MAGDNSGLVIIHYLLTGQNMSLRNGHFFVFSSQMKSETLEAEAVSKEDVYELN